MPALADTFKLPDELPEPPYTITIVVDADGVATSSVEANTPPPESSPGELSAHFTWHEATYSETATREGIPNTPTDAETNTIKQTTAPFMERVREILGDKPITVNSWFRNEAVNAAVGGSPTSEHRYGRAVDFTLSFASVYDCCKALAEDINLPFNQLIYENHGGSKWVHISCAAPGVVPRRELLTIDSNGTHAGIA